MSKISKAELSRQNNDLLKQLHELKNINKETPQKYEARNVINQSASRLFRFETDLVQWRNALNNVEQVVNPVYAELVRLMNEIKDDAIVENAIAIRKSYVMGRDWNFKNIGTNEVNEKANDFFSDYWFNDFISYTLDSIWWGYSLIKLGNIEKNRLLDIELVPRQNVNPKLKKVLTTPFDVTSGFYFDDCYIQDDNCKLTHIPADDKDWYILISDSKNNHYEGLYAKVAPYQIMHKAAMIAQNDFTQRFGSPTVVYKTDINNEKTLRQVESFASNLNNSSYAITNLTDEVQLMEATGKSSDVYTALEKRAEELIMKLLLGSTISNEQSFVGSADIKQNLANLFSLKDLKYIEFAVNQELIPRLINLGLTFLKGVRFDFDKTNKLDPTIQFNQTIALIQAGYKVPASYITDTFGIPVEEVAPALFPEENNSTESDVQAA